jgi:competence protein ComGC
MSVYKIPSFKKILLIIIFLPIVGILLYILITNIALTYKERVEDKQYSEVFNQIIEDCSKEVEQKYGVYKDGTSMDKEKYGSLVEECVNSKNTNNTNNRFEFKFSN